MRSFAALVLALALPPGLALAEASGTGTLTAEAFDALTLGQTMTWSDFGQVYGVEHYLPDRRVRWTVLGQNCVNGYWYPEGDAICFKYEDRETPACWHMAQAGNHLTAADTDDGPDVAPIVVATTKEPMACFGHEVGV